MFINSTFDPQFGVVQDEGIFMPKDWLVGYREGPFDGIQLGQSAYKPEASILNKWMGLEPELFPSDSYTWKIFGRNCLYSWFGPREILNLPAGTYTTKILVWPKLHMLDGDLEHPGDPWAGEVGLRLGEDEIQWKSDLDYSQYNLLEWSFSHKGGLLPLYFHFKGKYPIDNTFFFHSVSLVQNSTPTPPNQHQPVDIYLPQETRDWLTNLLGDISPEPEPEPEPPSFKVFNQRNPLWAADHLGTSQYTIGGSGCALVSTTMLATPAAPALNPRTHNQLIGAHNGYTSDGRLKWAVAAQVVDGMKFVAYTTYRGSPKPPANITYLKGLLSQGQHAVVQVDYKTSTEVVESHFVAVVAPVIIDGTLEDLIIADPYYGDIVRLMERYGRGTLEASIYAIAVYEITTRPYRLAVHGAPIIGAPDDLSGRVEQYKSLGVELVKLLHNGDPRKVELARSFLEAGIEPIVRIYDDNEGHNRNLESAKAMIAVGVKKFEVMNEPNIEWAGSWQVPEDVACVAETWFNDAQRIVQWGGNPGFVAMAPTERNGVNSIHSGVNWTRGVLEWLQINKRSTILSWLRDGRLWAAIHLLPFNKPFDWSPRQPWGIDDMCLGYYEYYKTLWKVLGTPEVIATEGGVVSPDHMKFLGWPSDGENVHGLDGHVLYNNDTWGDYTLSMYQWLRAHGGPPVCTWTGTDQGVIDNRWLGCGWYDNHGNPRSPAIVLSN